ncbi:F420-dependent oxidoreductase [Kutzneria sp. 744]|nr:F420-dependent oxidoreductase [Kutzneria sp. 744]
MGHSMTQTGRLGAEETRMRIGFTMPQNGPVANRPAELVRFAAEAERLGADALWVGDRLLSPLEPKVGYGMAGPGPFPPQFATVFDPFTALTLAATATSRVRLGTNVLNAPFYSPVPLARTLTSIDRASGAGWWRASGWAGRRTSTRRRVCRSRSGADGWTRSWTCWRRPGRRTWSSTTVHYGGCRRAVSTTSRPSGRRSSWAASPRRR